MTSINITLFLSHADRTLIFSLPKNVTRSAVRNFLPAFGAPGELIISLQLPGGTNYLFEVRFLVSFPSFSKLPARRRGPEYFSSYLLRR